MPETVLALFNGIMILIGAIIAGGTINSGLEKIAHALEKKEGRHE